MSYIEKIGMVIVMEPDLEAAVSFYKDLGLRLRFHLKDKWAEFEVAGVKLGICPTARPATDLVRTGIVLEVKDLHATYKALADTVVFLGEPVEAVHGIMVSFQDPGGNVLDLYQPTPERIKELVEKTIKENPEGGCCKSDENDQEDGCCGGGCEPENKE